MGKPELRVAASPLTSPNFTEFSYRSMEEAFPNVNPGLEPCGYMGIFQIRHPKTKTKGGIILAGEDRKTEHYNTQVAKVIALGPWCFQSLKETPDGTRDVLVSWPGGAWFRVGSYVRVPRYGGDRFAVSFQRDETAEQGEKVTVKDQVIFAIFKVKDILGIAADPLAGMAYLD